MTKELQLDIVHTISTHENGCHWRQLNFCSNRYLETKNILQSLHLYKNEVQTKPRPLTDMEVVDLEKKSLEDTIEEDGFYGTNDQTADADTNGELTQEDVDKFQQNHWQFSDEGKSEDLRKRVSEKGFFMNLVGTNQKQFFFHTML